MKYYSQTCFPVDGMARIGSDMHLSSESDGGQAIQAVCRKQQGDLESKSKLQLSMADAGYTVLGISRAARAGPDDCTSTHHQVSVAGHAS